MSILFLLERCSKLLQNKNSIEIWNSKSKSCIEESTFMVCILYIYHHSLTWLRGFLRKKMALPVEVVQKLHTKKRDRKGWSESELFQTLEKTRETYTLGDSIPGMLRYNWILMDFLQLSLALEDFIIIFGISRLWRSDLSLFRECYLRGSHVFSISKHHSLRQRPGGSKLKNPFFLGLFSVA